MSAFPVYLGVDIGSSSSKAALVDASGETVATASVRHEMSIPKSGWAEMDADGIWWHDFMHLCRTLFAETEYTGTDVAGIGVSAIGPCMLPLDGSGRPLRPGLLYGVDARATDQIDELERVVGKDEIHSRAGMDLSSQAVSPKILWLAQQEPELWAQTRMVTTASSYVTYRLTGEHVIDHHTAGHSILLYNPASNTWSDEFIELIVGPDRLPRLGWSQELAGTVTAAAAAATGLAAGTPVAVGAVDALSEAVGVGAVNSGDLMLMYGSTAFFVLIADDPRPAPGMWLVPGAFPGSCVVAAGMATTGLLTDWFRSNLAQGVGYGQLFAEAAQVPPGSKGLIVLPYFSGERTPINDPDARGVVAGLSLAHGRKEMFRAILEGVAYGIRHNLEAMRGANAPINRMVAVGGGTAGDLWPQIVSDVSGVEQQIPVSGAGAVLGNAFLGAIAAGHMASADLDRWTSIERTLSPEDVPEYDEGYRKYTGLYPAVRSVM
jgi:xylulokinase